MEWINTKDHLPDRNVMCLVTNGTDVCTATLDVKEGWWEDGWRVFNDVTHWAVIPNIQI